MDLIDKFLLNFTSVVAVFLTTIVTFFTVIHKLKNRWPVKVNCWFCNNDSKIYRQQRDWWLCPFCDQHNGFTKDGDYNYDIPEQQKASMKTSVRYTELSTPKESVRGNSLCSKCNENEEFKIIQLANFEPSNNKKYDHELEIFKKNLELKYKLCQKCSKIVESVLSKQASWLLQYKMAFFKNRHIQHIINSGEKWERVFRIFLTILNAAILYDAAFWPLPIAGLILQLGACLASQVDKQGLDMVAAFFWIFIIILMPFKELKLLNIHLENEWFSVEYITQYHVIVGLTVMIGLMNLKSSSFNGAMKSTVSLKKLESPNSKKIQSIAPPTDAGRTSPSVKAKTIKSEKTEFQACRSPVNITNLLMTPVSVETPMPIKPTIFMQNSGIFQNDLARRTPVEENCNRQNSSSCSFNSFSYHSFDSKSSLNESLSTLSSLSLSTKHRKQVSKTPRMFQTRVYDCASPDLFTKLNRSPNRKFVLSPPKLKSVTQTSWVAGGYWQAGMDVPTLSRSSSQSSGFGSTGSNFVPSREPSVYNDCDQYSVVSDITQCCHNMSRQKTTNSMTSCCRRGSVFSFQRPDSPVYNQFSKVPQSATFQNSSLPSFQYFHNNKHYENQTFSTNRNNDGSNRSNNHLQDNTTQTIRTTTILASPVWLPALLCSSLVFNMIVLCTTLLR